MKNNFGEPKNRKGSERVRMRPQIPATPEAVVTIWDALCHLPRQDSSGSTVEGGKKDNKPHANLALLPTCLVPTTPPQSKDSSRVPSATSTSIAWAL